MDQDLRYRGKSDGVASPEMRLNPSGFHYAWVIVAVTFAVVVVSGGILGGFPSAEHSSEVLDARGSN